MKIKIKRFLCFLLILFWMLIIFIFSSMNGNESHIKSRGFIKKIITGNSVSSVSNDKSQNNVNQENNTNKKGNQINNTKKTNELDTKVRKLAHALEYFVLSILVMLLIFQIKKAKKFKYNLIGLIICFIYACTDEFHQKFIPGRGAQFSDVMIDTMGAFAGIVFLWIIICIVRFIKTKIIKKNVDDVQNIK